MAQYFSGTVRRIIFSKDDFYILSMLLDGEDSSDSSPDDLDAILEQINPKTPTVKKSKVSASAQQIVTVAGNVESLRVKVGLWFGFQASWTIHPRYGRQLKIVMAPALSNGQNEKKERISFLVGKGVPEFWAGVMQSDIPTKAFEAALSDVDVLKQHIPKMPDDLASQVVEIWEDAKSYFEVMSFLQNQKLSSRDIKCIWAALGSDAPGIIKTNPWSLCDAGLLDFAACDQLAVQANLNLQCEARLKSAILVAMGKRQMGHLYSDLADLLHRTRAMVQVPPRTFAKALADLHKEEHLVIDRATAPPIRAVYQPHWHDVERRSAQLLVSRMAHYPGLDPKYVKSLAKLVNQNPSESPEVIAAKAVDDWAEGVGFVLSTMQRESIVSALTQPVTVITGLPGAGKTTSLRAFVRICQEVGEQFLLVAPTGIASKRLRQVTGAPAYTIHKALEAKGEYEDSNEFVYAGIVKQDKKSKEREDLTAWGVSGEAPLAANVVVIDESSMVDQNLLYRLLDGTHDNCRLVFVGDAAQLPSVGPGNVLRQIIQSGLFPTYHLSEIFRQADTSQIVYASHDIFHGKMPDLYASQDFRLIPKSSHSEVKQEILQLAQHYHSDGERTFQVLSPRHGGPVGVTALNESLRDLLNPPSGQAEAKLRTGIVRVEDRVMVVKNNYDLEVFNGDMGMIYRIDAIKKVLVLRLDSGEIIHMPYADANKLLRMSYACTVHKMQGLETDVVIMPIVSSFGRQLQRNLFYTAITRAKKAVVLVGSQQAIARAVRNSHEESRNTLFKQRMQKYMETLSHEI